MDEQQERRSLQVLLRTEHKQQHEKQADAHSRISAVAVGHNDPQRSKHRENAVQNFRGPLPARHEGAPEQREHKTQVARIAVGISDRRKIRIVLLLDQSVLQPESIDAGRLDYCQKVDEHVDRHYRDQQARVKLKIPGNYDRTRGQDQGHQGPDAPASAPQK